MMLFEVENIQDGVIELHKYLSLSVQASITNCHDLKDKHLFTTVLVAGSLMCNKGYLSVACGYQHGSLLARASLGRETLIPLMKVPPL